MDRAPGNLRDAQMRREAETATLPAATQSSDDDEMDVGETDPVVVAPDMGAHDGNEEGETDEAEALRAAEAEQRAVSDRNHEVAQRMGSGTALKDARSAQRRLMRDLRSLQQTLASSAGESLGLSAHPIGDDIFHWRAVIAGPEGSAWEGGLFKLDLKFTEAYPLEPPHIQFLTKNVFHPNVYVDGHICLDTLKSCWSPTLDVETLLLSVTSLLSDPNPRSAANGAAARMYVENKPKYEERVREIVEESLEQSFTDCDEDNDEGDEN